MVYIVLAGGHSKQCIDIFEEANEKIEGVFDDFRPVGSHFYRGTFIVGKLSDVGKMVGESDRIFCAIGDNQKRANFVSQYPELNWIGCISSKAVISPSATIGQGNYIGATCKVLADSYVGNFCIINDGATVMHDCLVGSYTHLCPNSSLGGRVKIGDFVLLGTNATVNPGIKVENHVTVGSGAVVVKDQTKEYVTVKGVPAS